MSGFLSRLSDEFKDREFRRSYVAENTRRGLAYQIKALRESRGWSQAEFARRAGKPQSNVHRWEDPTYGKFNLSTIIEIASIFDIAVSVRFLGFEALLDAVADLRPEKLAVQSYDQELASLEMASTRQIAAKSSAIAAFYSAFEQPVSSSALRAQLNEKIKLPPLPREVSPSAASAGSQ